MGQITKQFADDMLERAERGLHPQFTVWEAKQLLLAWQEREALRKDAERYRKLCEVPGALDAFTAAYHNTQTKEQLDAAVDAVPAVG